MVFTKRKHGIYEVNVIEAPCNMFLVSNKMEITERHNLMALRAEVVSVSAMQPFFKSLCLLPLLQHY